MSTQPKAWKILGLTTTATSIEVGAAVDRLRRAWEPLLAHEDPEQQALGARKLQEITQAYEAIKHLSKPRGVDDWGEHMVFFGRLPDGTWGDRLKYHKDVYDGVTPRPGVRLPEPKRWWASVEGLAFVPAALLYGLGAGLYALMAAVAESLAAVARSLLRIIAGAAFATCVAAPFALMFADYLHQAAQHGAALQHQASLAAQTQCAAQEISVPASLLPPPADSRSTQAMNSHDADAQP